MVSVSKKVIPRHARIGHEAKEINPPLGVDLYLCVLDGESGTRAIICRAPGSERPADQIEIFMRVLSP